MSVRGRLGNSSRHVTFPTLIRETILIPSQREKEELERREKEFQERLEVYSDSLLSPLRVILIPSQEEERRKELKKKEKETKEAARRERETRREEESKPVGRASRRDTSDANASSQYFIFPDLDHTVISSDIRP